MLSLISSSAVNARADLWGDLLKVARAAASAMRDAGRTAAPPDATTADAANATDPAPPQARDDRRKSDDAPTRSSGGETPDEAAADAKAQEEFLKAQADLVDAIVDGKPLDAVSALIKGAGAQLERVLRPGIARAARPILAVKVSPKDRDASMQPPQVTVVNPGAFKGDLVYFVNGIGVTKDAALAEATALANRVERPVGLIYNATNGIPADLTEAIYDRTWPLVVPLVGQLVQANSTTRQVAHLIYHAKKRISIVSHSQGSIIVRNAVLMANTYTGGKAKDRVTWVATALPLHDEEICPKPDRFRGLANADDTLCQFVGLRLKPEKIDGDAIAAHDFANAYVNEIRPEDVRAKLANHSTSCTSCNTPGGMHTVRMVSLPSALWRTPRGT